MVPNVKINSSTLSEGGTGRLVCTPRILVGVNLKVEVTSLMKRILEACNWKLTACGEGCATSDGEGLFQILNLLLMMMEIVAIGPGLGHLPVSLFRTMRTVIISGGVRVHLVKV